MVKRLSFLVLFVLVLAQQVLAGNGGYSISVTINGFTEKELYLGYYLGDKQYLRDTAVANAQGAFVFQGDEPIPGGVYLVVLPPSNNFFQILVTQKEQQFTIQTTLDKLSENIQFKGSQENVLFYQYINFLSARSKEAEAINKSIQGTQDAAQREKGQKELEALNQRVTAYQEEFVRANPNALAAKIVEANIDTDMPDVEGNEEEKMMNTLYYLREHYFDRLDLANPDMLRTPFLFEKIDYFVNKLHFQHPDSLAIGIDTILARLRPAEESFKYYLVHFLNSFATSKLVGMDAVYVHMVAKYYAAGDAPWIAEEQLNKIIDNARVLKPLLIGKTAPDIQMQKRDGTKVKLSEVNAEYTILYFWRYDCGHCKEQTPVVKAFYDKYKDKGVKIFAVCVKFREEVGDCWKYVDENGTGDWLHTIDPYLESRYYTIYNVKTTPQIYILDKNKEILSKNIGAEQLEEVIDKIIEMRKNEQ